MTKKNKPDWKIVCTGIACLTIVELYAIAQGMNGWMLTIFVGIVCAAIGVVIPKEMFVRK